jgi:signal transduction histidine kinase
LGRELIPWLVVVAVVDLVPVPIWGSVQLMMSFPVLLAAAMVFPPYAAGLLSFIGTLDTREFRHEIPFLRGLFNRSNVTVSVVVASALFRQMQGDVYDWPVVLLAASVALVGDLAVNSTLVIAGSHLLTGVAASQLIRNVYGGPQPLPFLASYACFGLLAVLLATVYGVAGSWGLLAFSIPLIMSRLMFVHWRQLGDASAVIRDKERAITLVTGRIADERREERLAVAAGIHDEILPPLYKIHLMGQVVRQDLASGRLFDLEADVPDLLHAVETADAALRDLIRDLRQSTVGAAGLLETLGLLARETESTSSVRVTLNLAPVDGSALLQLLVYQLAREAVANSCRHSGASVVSISLRQDEGTIRLQVADNGCGFDPDEVDHARHFGIQLMRERTSLAGGVLVVDSMVGRGTTVLVRIPNA